MPTVDEGSRVRLVRGVLRLLLTLVMDLLIVAAVALFAHIIIRFFGHLASIPWAVRVTDVTTRLVPHLGYGKIPTPYAGVFDFNAGAALGIVLAAEWVVAFVRRFFR